MRKVADSALSRDLTLLLGLAIIASFAVPSRRANEELGASFSGKRATQMKKNKVDFWVRALSGCRHWMGGWGRRVAERTLE